jgi:AcrR family transcriptional regulator
VKTAQLILEASIKLFNAEGVTRVSLRRIADEIGISHGNLAYHYKNKSEILDAIYTRMQEEMDDAVYPPGNLTLRHYHELLKRMSRFHDQYRFFYLDMLEITRCYPRVIERYRKTVATRFEQHDLLMADLIGKGLIKPEPEPGFYRAQFRSIWVMSTFWLQHKAILGEDHPVLDAGSDIRHVWEVMLQHLTAKGLREFNEICESERESDDHCPVNRLYSDLYLKRVI